MTIEIGLLFTLIGGIIGVVTFMVGRQSAAKNDGREWGEMKTDIKHIKDDVMEIKAAFGENSKAIDESIRRIYDRMDEKFNEHIKTYHT